jgi:microcystin-dependent protein
LLKTCNIPHTSSAKSGRCYNRVLPLMLTLGLAIALLATGCNPNLIDETTGLLGDDAPKILDGDNLVEIADEIIDVGQVFIIDANDYLNGARQNIFFVREYATEFLTYLGLEIQKSESGEKWLHHFKAIKSSGTADYTTVMLATPKPDRDVVAARIYIRDTSSTITFPTHTKTENPPPTTQSVEPVIYKAFPFEIEKSRSMWSQTYLGEIKLYPYTYTPAFSALCDGSQWPVAGNEVLHALLGFTFGGDGETVFALPDLDDISAPSLLKFHISTNGSYPNFNGYLDGEIDYFALPATSWNSSDYWMGEIVLGKNLDQYMPSALLPCDGRTLSIDMNYFLYDLLGNRFGGDGHTSFALPNMSEIAPPVAGANYYIVAEGGIYPQHQ